ncbi:5-(carboxyamino)imidazole ribonucleotide synthase [Thermoanaerobacter brockii subsp. lactiethylicus]|jgi:5-(carboxyamino)imidazole ribonucleotide synthase|uniref:N5-carboxyaminoimidazole ribonucleotide synthase n=2 Tax=Thermoanaerobacter TaxID=1754 RepID=B0KC86_THEP3|nr:MULTISPECIES: 5-(carboxyamino)imidazole ribonucleotide synthase [Thermoanaerobacter]ABY91742.1 phosphoribosylaminoimidazole carboxylase, ATPase subunit [Thermoanaerobacter sp. X514]ABY95440.1 phosphoribosylaminoimidazole carboxylase, ATPase subunit [Thermoanaerobacter pseudethanolicus ATCC 33223]ADV80384.1 phosphoribosylaminoimidazole carboxylase, ATPase subunit [Thermoanaerobacter brockii subsp. finnii Ako-1]MBZ4655715.1 phosphoribosylaminoimidazole carboxylase, ATPase subunit [Thermoanaero
MTKRIFGYPIMKIGIIGGGQLGKMFAQKAKQMGFYVIILDPNPECPATQVADEQIIGDYYNENKLKELVEKSDVTTYEIEHINTAILKELFDKGYKIYPSPYSLEIIQDKLKQKQVLKGANLPVPRFEKVENFEVSFFEKFGFPFIQKATKGGYDGRGVVVIKDKNDLDKMLRVDSLIEEFVDMGKELAVMVARNLQGEIKCYPVVEMVFDESANILDLLIAPARIEKEIEENVKEIAIKAVEALDGIGIFGIEMFLTKDKKILINEIAPRPHNSGHYTIEACVTSQFEQHLRAICGFALGSTELLSPAVMINLLGEKGYRGVPLIEGLEEVLSIEGVSFHFYGKRLTSPYRKMGHVTIVDDNLDSAIEKAKKVKERLKIKSEVER